MDKNTLRQHYKKLRAALSEQEQLELSLSITNRLLELPLWEKTYFHLFMRSAQHNEVDTEAILTLLQGKDKQVVIPRMEAENSLAHILLTDATLIRPNAWGIPEPVGGLEVPVNTLEVVFVPLLAYDKETELVMGRDITTVFSGLFKGMPKNWALLFPSRGAITRWRKRHPFRLLH